MNMRLLAGFGLVILVGAGVLVARQREPATQWYEPVQVGRGERLDEVHLLGELAARDPVLATVGFAGRIEFVVADGSWIEVGAPLVVISEDDAMKDATESRSQLLQARQELRLARIKRRHAEQAADLTVAKAERAVLLERMRYRIRSSTPVGGEELVRLDAELKPKEAVTAAVRAEQERIQAAFQQVQDAFLAATDARAVHRDRVLRLESRIAELAAVAERSLEGLQEAEQAEVRTAAEELLQARRTRAALATEDQALAETLRVARTARDAARPARDAMAEKLAAAEAAEEDLRVRLEIEKAHLGATLLRLDQRSTQVALDDALRRRDQGRQSFAAGAMAQAAFAELEDAAQRLTNQLDIVGAKIAIAERPLPPEVQAEAEARVASAVTKVSSAQGDRTRALGLADQELVVLEARITRLADQTATKSGHFPEILESNLEFLEQELAVLDAEDADDAQRRTEIEQERSGLLARLEQARRTPPNVIVSPVAGVVRLTRTGDRARQVGDQLYEQDVVAEIVPPGRMEVQVRANEVEVRRLAPGQRAQITVPALPDCTSAAEVVQISQLGRDKFADDNQTAGVTQFAVRLTLATTAPELRQGMTALVSITIDRRADVLWLPRSALRHEKNGWSVLGGDARQPSARVVEGEAFGTDAFLITSGLGEGETVFIERRSNQ